MTTCKKITLTAAAMVLSAGLAVGGTLILQQHLQKQNGPVIQERIIFQEM